MDRKLDGVFFRVNRNGKWQSVCFSDLTDEEMDEVLEAKSREWIKSLCKILGKTIKQIGDELNIMNGKQE